MKPILLILLLTVTASTQTTTYDKYSDTTVTRSKEVRLYRNSGGLLVYFPDEVSATLYSSPKSGPTLSLRVNSFRWQFTDKMCKVYALADGERIVLPCKVASYNAYRLRRDIYVTETVTTQDVDLLKVLKAKEVSMRVGTYDFKVKEKDLKTLAQALGNP